MLVGYSLCSYLVRSVCLSCFIEFVRYVCMVRYSFRCVSLCRSFVISLCMELSLSLYIYIYIYMHVGLSFLISVFLYFVSPFSIYACSSLFSSFVIDVVMHVFISLCLLLGICLGSLCM